MSQPQEAYISYRLERARDALSAAEVLAESGHWNRCVNSLYYACFYAASALIVQRGLSSSRHSGILSLFQQHFVRTGLISRDFGRFYQRMFERRQESDYQDLIWFEEQQVRPWLDETRRFISAIEDLLRAPGGLSDPI